MNRNFLQIVTGSVVLMIGMVPLIAGAHFDFFVTTLGTQTGIGGADVDDGAFDVTTRVFESVLIGGGSADFSRNEPGFFGLSSAAPTVLFPAGATALPANTTVTLAFAPFRFGDNIGSLFYWNGSGAVDFQVATETTIALDAHSALTGYNGELDFHPEFQLEQLLSVPADGVYLAAITATAGGLAPAPPAYLVMLVDATITSEAIAESVEDEIEAGTAFPFFPTAVAHVEAYLVPEPGTAVGVLLGTMCASLPRRRRRRPA